MRLCFPFGIESWHSWLVLELHYVSVRNWEMEKPRWAMVLRADRIRLGWPGKLSLEFLDGCCQPKWDSSFILNLPVHKNISHLLRMRLIISIIKLYRVWQVWTWYFNEGKITKTWKQSWVNWKHKTANEILKCMITENWLVILLLLAYAE